MDPEQQRYIDLINRRREAKQERYFLDLQANEQALLQAASRIYAAYVQAGRVDDANADAMVARSVHEGVKLAYLIERSTMDAEEKRPQID